MRSFDFTQDDTFGEWASTLRADWAPSTRYATSKAQREEATSGSGVPTYDADPLDFPEGE